MLKAVVNNIYINNFLLKSIKSKFTICRNTYEFSSGTWARKIRRFKGWRCQHIICLYLGTS